ncbi:MAG: ABC-F family ATP-binding cassette domain-containing protein [Candidatus Cloacimonetes bacterium]|nr:ABC-F family ATP-binding cassette domain-containing protein [Candidatus Cloacimonadota bacterium]
MSKNIISIEKLSKSYAEKVICENASFGIHENDKIGLIGINGCGKSTFLKMLTGKENIDNGSIIFRSNIKIGYLQQIPDLDNNLSVYQQIYFSNNPKYMLLREYHQLENEMKKTGVKLPELVQKQQELMTEIDAQQGWDIEIKARKFLDIMGFSDLNINTGILSGGQKRRLDLARVLMDDPDVLILDEPTNHLDVDIIEWLQEYLSSFKGIIIFVTHDRYFLDAVSNRVMEMENGKIKFYDGNYGYYLQKKEFDILDMDRKETRRQAQLKKEIKWLHRGAKARTSKPKNHIDRVKELIDKSYLVSNAELDIAFASKRMGNTILELKDVAKTYGDNHLFAGFTHIFQKMERIGIIGTNGCGKTTLLRLITGEEISDTGKVKVGLNTKFAYFRQEEQNFDPDQKVIDYIRDFAEHIRTKDGVLHSASEMLEKFLFDGKMQQSKLKSLSGGETKRLYLLSSLMFGANFVVLDEPTNDLDIKTLEILEDYLDAFQGCILTVSHDRFFLDRVVDYLFIFTNDGIIKFPGNYSDYLLVKRFKDAELQESKNINAQKQDARRKADKPKKLGYLQIRELEEIENKMENLENTILLLQKQILENAGQMSPADFKENTEKQEMINNELYELEERWLELSSQEE